MSKLQKKHSIFKIAYNSLTRTKQEQESFKPLTIRVANFYCRPIQLQTFTKSFAHPNDLPSFAFVATFKLVLQCLAQSNIPSNLVGLIHLSSDFNIISRHNWLLPSDIEVSVKEVTKDEKGLNYLIVTKLYQNGQLTMINSNRMLDKDKAYRKSRSVDEDKAKRPLSKTIASTVLSIKTAWYYARISSDFNPIHLNSFLAKKMGLKRALIHGMFNLHFALKYILKEQEQEQEQEHKISNIKVQFNRPCFLPNQVFLKQYTDTSTYGLFGKDKTERYLKIDID